MSARGQDLSAEERIAAVAAIVADSQDLIVRNTGASGFAYEIGANVATANAWLNAVGALLVPSSGSRYR
jgi:hypothetical protein